MAVDVCSEVSSPVVSPRISFSHDLRETDAIPRERYHHRSDALLLESIDFNFSISQSFSQGLLSSADELFANGKIIPFWQFRRSSSLNLNSSRSSTLIRSLHFLSRSNSTGSAPNPTASGLPKVLKKQHSQKDQPPWNKRTDSSVPSSSGHFFYTHRAYRSPGAHMQWIINTLGLFYSTNGSSRRYLYS